MKLTLGLACTLLLCAATAHAQTPSVGVRAGVNLADLSFSPEPEVTDSKNLTGFVAGVFVTVPVSNIVAFQPEVLFSQQGTRFSEGGLSAKIKLDYLQLPLLARIKLAPKSPVSVLAGPSLGFRTGAKFEMPGAPIGFDDDFEDQVERFDVGLVAGVAVEVGHVLLDGRYTWGLLNVINAAGDPGVPDPGTAKHRVFSASVGFRF